MQVKSRMVTPGGADVESTCKYNLMGGIFVLCRVSLLL